MNNYTPLICNIIKTLKNVLICLQGGLSTKEEMCLAFISYYPRIEMARCFTYLDIEETLSALQIETNDNTIT